MTAPSRPTCGAGGTSRRRDGPRRYGERKRLVDGVGNAVLIRRLKGVASDRLIVRTDDKQVPPRAE